MRVVGLSITLPLLFLALGSGCGSAPGPSPGASVDTAVTRASDVQRLLHDLAADSMEGRGTATRGEVRAASYIAARLAEFGVEPAGDSAFFQRVPLQVETGPEGRRRLRLLTALGDLDPLPPEQRAVARNVVGIIRGSDPALRDEALIVGAHFDHLGIGRPVNGDSIFNGADDDASGVVAVLEIARALASGPPPARSVVFFLATGEEVGMLGTQWYLTHPAMPIEATVAGLFVEMIGRPDELAGGHGKGWLTGFGRSTMGRMLAEGGIPLVADPRPEQNFFERSDNTPFARRGVPAHVISSYNLHAEYHTVEDEVERVDIQHMTEVIAATVGAARLLANGPAPAWHPDGQP